MARHSAVSEGTHETKIQPQTSRGSDLVWERRTLIQYAERRMGSIPEEGTF